MKLWIKLLIIATVIIALFLTATYLFLVVNGKALIAKSIEGFTHKKASIGYLEIRFPLNIQIRKLEIKELASIEKIYISPSILGLLTGNLAFNNLRIVNPEFTFEKKVPVAVSATEAAPALPDAVAVLTAPAAVFTASDAAATMPALKIPPPQFVFKRLQVKNAKINFIDHTAGKEGIKISAKDINFELNNFHMLSRSAIANFKLEGKIPWQEGRVEGRIEAEGWFNFAKRDIQAHIKISDIDGVYLYPYYSQWVDLEKARIEKAKLNFTSDIQGLNNNVTAACRIELADIVRKPRPSEEGEDKAEKITDAVLDIFRALNQGKIVLDFTIRTRMDRPEFGFGSIRMAFEDKIAQGRGKGIKAQDVIAAPGRLLEGTVKTTANMTRAMIEGLFAVVKEFKKGVLDTFKK